MSEAGAGSALGARDVPRRALRALRRAGNRLVNRLDPPILVLAYHRVAALERDPESLAVRPERFRAQMRHLRERYPLLRFGDPWPRVDRPAAIVTFDDGYADNATTALPILEEERVPATFFVSVGAVETGREFWWDELERRLLAPAQAPERLELGDGAERGAWPLRTDEERRACYRDLHRLLRRFAPARRERWLDALRAACGSGAAEGNREASGNAAASGKGDSAGSPGTAAAARPSHRPLSMGEVARLGKSPWASVGAHGVTHTPFASLPLEEQREEMRVSRERLRAWSGAEVDAFSFPFGGRRDFTRDSVRLAREVGFRRVAANAPGQIHRWSDPLIVPRFLVRDWTPERFALELTRFETA